MDMILLDFSKAFDKVPHNGLLLKLNHYGIIQGQTLSWIKAFLSGRTQSVVLEGAKSEAVPVISGVPQGTVLGPTLFLLYINDLPLLVSSSTTILFADDCILYREIDSPADAKLLQHDLDALQNWERTWLMSFNPKKCSVMSFRPCRTSHNIEYTIHETVLTRSKTYKYLGLHLSDDFKWSTHISHITKKAYQQLCFVRRNTRNLPKSFRETAYKALIRPHVEYCSSVWDPHTHSDIQKIERSQRQAARYVTGDYRRSSSVSEMIHNLKWTNLATRRPGNRLNNYDLQNPERSICQYSKQFL